MSKYQEYMERKRRIARNQQIAGAAGIGLGAVGAGLAYKKFGRAYKIMKRAGLGKALKFARSKRLKPTLGGAVGGLKDLGRGLHGSQVPKSGRLRDALNFVKEGPKRMDYVRRGSRKIRKSQWILEHSGLPEVERFFGTSYARRQVGKGLKSGARWGAAGLGAGGVGAGLFAHGTLNRRSNSKRRQKQLYY